MINADAIETGDSGYVEKYTMVNGVNIRYVDTGGKGHALFFAHGIGASLEFWTPQIKALSAQYRVIVWDAPGHGLSAAAALNADAIGSFAGYAWGLLDKLNVTKAHVAGNSMGGAIAIHMAGQQPERVIKIAALNGASLGKELPFVFRLMALPLLGKLLSAANQTAVDNQVKAIFYRPDNISNAIHQVILRNVMQAGNQAQFLAVLRTMGSFSGQKKAILDKSREILISTQATILFIHGRQDQVIPLQHSQQAAQLIADKSQLIVIEDCGHTPQLEKPQDVNNLLLTFFSEKD
jgi:2-hydroxy-6-oxonona-2,4-dienedioate hydrolase